MCAYVHQEDRCDKTMPMPKDWINHFSSPLPFSPLKIGFESTNSTQLHNLQYNVHLFSLSDLYLSRFNLKHDIPIPQKVSKRA